MRQVSVIMPCHDAGRFLAPAVASVLEQDKGGRFGLELVILDDASSDPVTVETLRAVAKDPRVRVVRSRSCLGAAAARNMALGHATGDYIAFLDGDDLWEPNHLDLHLALRAGSSATLTSTDYDLIDDSGQVVTRGVMMASPQKGPRLRGAMGSQTRLTLERPRRLFVEACPAWTGSVVVDRGVLTTTSPFDDRRRYAEDVDLWTRLSARCRFTFAPTVTAQHRQNPNSLVSTAARGMVDLALAEVYADLRRSEDFLDLAMNLRSAAATNFFSAAHASRHAGGYDLAGRCAWRGIRLKPFMLRGYQELLLAALTSLAAHR
jgi:glycosyltransferase involved in cell wall biosynthesis